MNVNWGVRQHGMEAFPPMLGVDEFAVVNPDFWSGTPEEQQTLQGWYRFSDVSCFLFYGTFILNHLIVRFSSGLIVFKAIMTPSPGGWWCFLIWITINCGMMLTVRITCSG